MSELETLSTSLSGRYEIIREIGAGGMATVYLAHDLKHARQVALKVLKPELGVVLGVERFLAEIKVTANLQHPNLLPLFDSGEANGLLFYVMPFVEGESLRTRLEREKQLSVDEAVRIAVAIAGALDYAHRHGVIHRDLKPENLLLHEGQPLIADFGIALAVSNAGGSRITQTGLSLGTPQYMSPEQATGDRVVDGRSDIFSLAAVTYEMLTGEAPHTGTTAQAIIARLLTEKPRSIRASRSSVPAHVEWALEHALEKLPADRFATAREFGDALSGKSAHTENAIAASAATTAAAMRPRFGKRDVVYLSLLIFAAASAGKLWMRAREREYEPVVRFLLQLPKDHQTLDATSFGPTHAVSPRGDMLAYVAVTPNSGGNSVWIRSTDQLAVKELSKGGGARTPTFSPDGRWVAFTVGSEVKKVSVEGGPVVTLATIPDNPMGLSWGSRGALVVGSASSGLYVVDESGGTPRNLPKAANEGIARWPVFLADGTTVLYSSGLSGSTATHIKAMSLTSGERTKLDILGSAPVGFLDGQMIYSTPGGTLMSIPFDPRSHTVGSAVPVEQEVVMDGVGGTKATLSASGTLVYRSGTSQSLPILSGSAEPMVAEPRDFGNPRFSPDGGRVALTIVGAQSTDIWIFDRAKTTLTKVTTEGVNLRAEWSPDGKRILFVSDRGGKAAFWWQPADGSGPAELLYQPAEGDPYECVMSPDGKWLVYRTGPSGHPARSIFALAFDGKSKSIPVVIGSATSFIQMPRLSPDGKWLAYQSNETGRFEIYVRPFPGAGGRMQVSSGGGGEPIWSRSGHMLYYRQGQTVMGTSVTTGTSFAIGDRKIVLTGDYMSNPSHPNYDITPDGKQFLMLRRTGDEVRTIVVHNWRRELAAKTANASAR